MQAPAGDMIWLEVSVRADLEAAEAISELFHRYGQGGVVIEQLPPDLDPCAARLQAIPQVTVKAYLDAADVSSRKKLEEALWHLGQLYPLAPPVFKTLSDKDWATAWRQDYHTQHIGQHIVIVPSWETYSSAADDVALVIDPGMAFGTGLHPSTRLCLRTLEQLPLAGQSLLDLGTGSGILALYAAKVGARPIVALDTDLVAVQTAQENARLNSVAARVQIAHGSLTVEGYELVSGQCTDLFPGPFGVIVVNILAEVIAQLTPALAAHLQPEGCIIASGILAEQDKIVEAAWTKAGLIVAEKQQEGDWIALIGLHSGSSMKGLYARATG